MVLHGSSEVRVENDLRLDSDSSVLSMGIGNDATLTHDGTTGLTIAATPVSVNSTGNLTLDSTTDIVLSGSSEVRVENDLRLDSDSAVFSMGAGDDFTITHDGTTGVTIKGEPIVVQKAATTAGAHQEIMRLEIKDEGVDMNIGNGPGIDFYVGETGGSNYGGTVAVIREEASDADSDAAMVFHTATDDQVPSTDRERMRITSAGKVGIGLTSPKTLLTVEGAVTLKEQSAADSDTAALGQLWVKDDTPNKLYFTNDAGDDIQITSGTSLASTGDITGVTAGDGLSGGGTSGGVTLALDLDELTGATIADGDSIVFIDANDSNASRKETLSDFLDVVAGTVATTGLDRSGATLVVSDLHPVGVNGAANQLLTDDGDGTVSSEGNLTFNGSILKVVGAMSGSSTSHVVGAATFGSTLQTSGSVKVGSAAGSGQDAFLYTAGTAAHVGIQWDADGNTEGTLIGGADDHGVDFKFFGETAGKYVQWDMSGDELVLASSSKLSFHDASGGENIVASSDGHLEINAGTTLDMTAPTTEIHASTVTTIDSPIVSVESSTSARPRVIIKNTTNDADAGVLRFVKDKGAAGAADDNVGVIEFYGDDANQDQVLFGRIRTRVAVHTDGQEGGKMHLSVASHDGELNHGLVITDGSAEDEVDVTIVERHLLLLSDFFLINKDIKILLMEEFKKKRGGYFWFKIYVFWVC